MQNQEDMANFFLVLMPIRKKRGHITRTNMLYDFVNVPASCQPSCQYCSSSINQQEYGPISSPGVEQFGMHEFLVVKQSFPLRLVLSSALHELCTRWIRIYLLSYMQISKNTKILLSPTFSTGSSSRESIGKQQDKGTDLSCT